MKRLIPLALLASAPLHAQAVQTAWSAEVVVDNMPVPPMLLADNPTDIRKAAVSLCAFVPDDVKPACLQQISALSFTSLTAKGADMQRYRIKLVPNEADGWKTYIVIYAQGK